MRVHHLNCGCMCPVGGKLFDGFSSGLTASLVCHCLLIETDGHGLVLVDTGFGSCDVLEPRKRLSSFFIAFHNIKFGIKAFSFFNGYNTFFTYFLHST